MSSNHMDDVDINSIAISLEDTYEHLKEIKRAKEQEILHLMNIVQNNEVKTLGPNITPDEIRHKRLRFVKSMLKFAEQEQPKDLPNPELPDFYAFAEKELEKEVNEMEELHQIIDKEISELEADIAYMENKKSIFKQLKETSINTTDNETTNYKAEMVVTKHVFQEVKKDLATVVDILFPGNQGFQEFLCVLTRALTKGGDDLYIDVTPEILDFVNFLHEADIVQFHPNDKTKIKLRDL